MACHRCSTCNIDWPVLVETYITFRSKQDFEERCAVCFAPTDYIGNVSAVPTLEAKALAGRAEHIRRESQRDKARAQRGEITPEQEGALEAREIAELNRRTGVWPDIAA